MKVLLSCFLLLPSLLAAQSVSDSPTQPIKDLIEVQLESRLNLGLLQQLASDVDDHGGIDEFGRIHVYATTQEQEALTANGFRFEVLIRDLAGYYEDRLLANSQTRMDVGSMGGWRTLAEIYQEMDRLASTYPSLVSPRFSIGSSREGRQIYAMRLSDNPTIDEPSEPVAWFDALHHAREVMSAESLLMFADQLLTGYGSDPESTRILDSRNVIMIPCCNPDGYEYNRQTNPNGGGLWRKNRRNNGGGVFGVDLNRNYGYQWGSQWPGSSGSPSSETYRGPSAFSEPETQALRDFFIQHPAGMAISAHTFSDIWLYPWGYNTVFPSDLADYRFYGGEMTANNGWPEGTIWELLYIANGVTVDWHYANYGTFSFTPEIGNSSDGFWPSTSRIDALFNAVQPGYQMVAKWTGGWADIDDIQASEVIGNGNSYPEPGETWDYNIDFSNNGVASVALNLQLSSNSADVVVLNGSDNLNIASRNTATSGALRVQIAGNAGSQVYVLDLSLTYDGVTSVEPFTLALGKPRVLMFDDMETNDFGWSVNNSTNYSWERANPQQTTSGGQTVQPGSDNPAGSGVNCWVTGASSGGSAGTNDVDGTTILTSPLFRSSGFGSVELSYARWFANQPGGPLDDVFLAEVSNDDGSSWTTLETTANDNQWRTVSFKLENYVSLTDEMRVRFTAADDPNNDLTEAAIDDLEFVVFSSLPTLGVWGDVDLNQDVSISVDGPANVAYEIGWSFTSGSSTVPGFEGTFELSGNVTWFLNGNLDATGAATIVQTVPNKSALAGRTLYLQARVDMGGSQAAFSNLLTVNIP